MEIVKLPFFSSFLFFTASLTLHFGFTSVLNYSSDRMADSINTKAMRIHGKWYDVERFDHPGGPVMISLGKGRDATGLFEVR